VPSITFRVSKELKEALQKIAERQGISVSRLLREIVSRALNIEAKEVSIEELEKRVEELEKRVEELERRLKQQQPAKAK